MSETEHIGAWGDSEIASLRITKSAPFNGRLAMHSAVFVWVKAHWGWLAGQSITEQELCDLIVETDSNYRELFTQANILDLVEQR